MEEYFWTTEQSHFDNEETMRDFIENHTPENYEVFFVDRTYAEMQNKNNGAIYGIYAQGNGDSFNHKVTFEFMR
jgi:hypothetical protein